MVTTANLISETEQYLLTGDRDEQNLLASGVNDTATTFTFTYDNQGIQDGAYISIDLEVCYVWAVDTNTKTATVGRGMLGSTAAAHSTASVVYVNPKFTKWQIFNALNVEIRDVSTPPNGLWQAKHFTLTTQPVKRTYTVPSPNTDLLDVLEVRYIEPGAEKAWIRMTRWEYSVLRDMPTTGDGGFTTGFGLRFDRGMYPGRTLNVVYAAPFSELTNLTNDVVAVTGLPATAVDIPPLGAAARLMGVREAKRAFAESEVDTRRASEVPVGASARAAQTLLALLNERIKSEYMRLVRQWPEMM